MAKRKPKVGETLFLRYRQKGIDCTVTEVKRKYFSVTETHPKTRFYILTWCEKTEYNSMYHLYESRQEWKDAYLTTKYRKAIKDAFVTGRFGDNPAYNATLSQLKQIAEILNITLEKDKA